MHVYAGEEVVSLFLVSNTSYDNNCYSTSFWAPIPVILYGEYNDYGAVENFTSKFDNLLIEYIKRHMFEMTQGPNQYHDPAAVRNELDLEQLYELDHEDRLWFAPSKRSMLSDHMEKIYTAADIPVVLPKLEEGKDRAYGNFAYGPKVGSRVSHIVIKKSLFDKLLSDYTYEDWAEDETGKYVRFNVSFSDLLSNIDDDLEWVYKQFVGDEELKDATPEDTLMIKAMRRFRTNDMHSTFWQVRKERPLFSLLPSGSSQGEYYMPNINVWELFISMYETDKQLAKDFILEIAKFSWLKMYVSHSRIAWTPQVGAGSQSSELTPYQILGQYLLDEVARERKEYEEVNDE